MLKPILLTATLLLSVTSAHATTQVTNEAASVAETHTASFTAEAKESTYIEAIKLGKIEQVKQFLEQKIAVDTKEGGHYTGLFFASAKGYGDIATLLIKQGADVNARGRGKWTPLMAAALHGHSENISLLVKGGANPEAMSADGMTPLMYAVYNKKESAVKDLIRLKANVSATQKVSHATGKSVLAIAVDKSNVSIVKQLIAAGAAIDAQEHSGRTPLMYAVEKNQADLIKLLVSKGANLAIQDRDGNSVLHRAVKRATPETVELLLSLGANRLAVNKKGLTPLVVAANSGNIEVIELLAKKASKKEKQKAFIACVESGFTKGMEALITEGVDINSRNDNAETALMIASWRRHHLIVEKLLELESDSKAVSRRGWDALMYSSATVPAKLRTVEQLLTQNVNISRKDAMGNTALILAAKVLAQSGANEEIVAVIEALIKAGADPSLSNAAGQSARSIIDAERNPMTNWSEFESKLDELLAQG